MATKNLSVKLSLNDKQFQSALNKATRSMKKFGRSMQRTGQTLSRTLTLPIVTLGAASVKAFDSQQKAIAQVEAGIISTGQAAGFTSQELQKMAQDLQGKTLFGDEVILKDATAQLLTFTNISGEQFARTQEAALNLATRLDGDLKSASIQLGKALNDPVANLSALSRSGIQFSTDQKEVINSLVETGRLAEAQTIILDELEKQYGGAAEAARLAGLGPFQALGMVLGDLSEEFGAIIMENLEPFRAKVEQITTFLQGLTDEQRRNIVQFAGYAAVIGPVLIIFGKLAVTVGGLINSFKSLTMLALANPFVLLGTAVAGLVSIMGFAILDTENFIRLALKMGKVGKFIAKIVLGALSAINPKYQAYFSVIDETSEALDKQEKNLSNSTKSVNANKEAIDKLTNSLQNLNNQSSGDVNINKDNTSEFTPIASISPNESISSLNEDLNTIPDTLSKVNESFQSTFEEMDQTSRMLESTMINAFMATADASEASTKDMIKSAKNAAREQIKTAIAVAVAEKLKSVFASVPFPLNVALAAGAASIVGSLFAKLIPPFAEGGLVSGATIGMVGEGPRTSISNPEVIAPLDKLKGFIGEGGGAVEVFGTISGQDILLSSTRASNNRLRTRGY